MGKTARTLAAAGFVLVAAMPSSAQDRANIEHVRALIAKAMIQQGGQPPAGGLPVVQETGPVIRLSVDEAVARAMDKNLTIASERITPQTWDFVDRGFAGDLPAQRHLGLRQQQPDEPEREPLRGGRHGQRRDAELVRRPRAEHVEGRRQLHGQLDQHRVTIPTATTPPSTRSTTRGCRRATCSRLMRNFKIDNDAGQPADQPDQPADLGNQPERDGGEHRRVRTERVLGTGLRGAGRGSGAALARALVEARAGQPVARGDRHDGADRRRAGAGRAGDPPPDARQRRRRRCATTSWRSSA